MDLKDLAAEIHATAVEKGWWDGGDRPLEEQAANFHAEVSEAWEEWRNGHSLTEVYYVDGKPEGIPIELADVIIRILDSSANYGWPTSFEEGGSPVNWIKSFADLVARLHGQISKWDFQETMAYIWDYSAAHSIDIQEAIRIKRAYNATRPHRHGGKRA
jgi:hypothetical protein